MSWNYTGDPSTSPMDEVRFLIGDTRQDFGLLSDEEITYVLNMNGQNTSASAIQCCQQLIARFASDVNYSIGPEKVEAENRYKQYKELLSLLKNNKTEANTDFGMAEPGSDLAFDLGMHDNR